MPFNNKILDKTKIHPIKERYQDVNKNEIKFLGRAWVETKNNGEHQKLPILITQKNEITPLLGVNWLKQLPITINKLSLDKNTANQKSTTNFIIYSTQIT